MVQPDVFILCNASIIDGPGLSGAPDLIIEALSDSTRKKDLILKSAKVTIYGFHDTGDAPPYV